MFLKEMDARLEGKVDNIQQSIEVCPTFFRLDAVTEICSNTGSDHAAGRSWYAYMLEIDIRHNDATSLQLACHMPRMPVLIAMISSSPAIRVQG